MNITQKITRLFLALILVASCNAHAADHNKLAISRHAHFGTRFPKPGLCLALKKWLEERPKSKKAQDLRSDNAFFTQNVTQGVLDLPLILEEKQS